ncbi:MAG: helix-turn-helix domain-containing protein, partial [Thermoplasmata archaeon]|nr:helix-turn-helix domain-containing protein [Thermoplasmata archaeon]
LLHSDERVDIIAERVGYADATHFIRMFRRAHGATPAAWRAAVWVSREIGQEGERAAVALRASVRRRE